MNSNLLFLIPLLVIGLLFLIYLPNKLINWILLLTLLVGFVVTPIGQTYFEKSTIKSVCKNDKSKCEKCEEGDDACDPCK
ncbi:hypothetical protein QUF74_12980 [Candidatus Halobeggiatoa sp. HSG11]|nr:hypothetical protein [Candidatus Halobeggiatoa sp. HSG11]